MRSIFHSGVILLVLVGTRSFAAGRGVVLLVADDLGRGVVGCYGNPMIQTPNIDRLASEGTCYTHAFATTASCSPSRSVILTGLHNHANGQYGLAHAAHNFHARPNVESVFQLVRKIGGRTALIGKKHVLPESTFAVDFEPKVNARDVSRLAELAGEFLKSVGDEAFLLVVGFADPHRDFGNKGKYPGVERITYDPSKVLVPAFLPDQPEVREELAQYYQSISRMDQGVGKVLQQLDASGRDDDTLVLFTSDNGMPFPGAKTTVYEPGVRLPLILREPKQETPSVSDAMVSFVDITPTILDWFGAPSPEKYKLHGRSLLPTIGKEHAEGFDVVHCSHTFHEVTMYYPMRVVRERRYKLILNMASALDFPFASDLYGSATWQGVLDRNDKTYGKRPTEKYLRRDRYELYDLDADPDELVNLASDPAHSKTFERLSKQLEDFQHATMDPWITYYDYRRPKPAKEGQHK